MRAIILNCVAALLIVMLRTADVFAAADHDRELTTAASSRGIAKIKTFLDQCPSNDPAFSTILLDFAIRRDGRPVSVPFCSEPVSAMPVEQYTDELILLQGLRVMYYMDRGQNGHLPWTSLTLYDWMKSKVGGINISSGGGSYCCDSFDNKVFIGIGAQNDLNRQFDKKWIGIAGNIDLYAHEARHVDGFAHVSCCGIPNGCDDAFDTSNLSPYGVQWWLNAQWLNGAINVGYACMSFPEVAEATNWFRDGANSQFRERFCTQKPSEISAPATPGGSCATGAKRRAVGR